MGVCRIKIRSISFQIQSKNVRRSISLNFPKKQKRRPPVYPNLNALSSTQCPSLTNIPPRRDSKDSLDSRYDSQRSRNVDCRIEVQLRGSKEEVFESEPTTCSKVCRILRIVFVVASLVLAVADLSTDWWAVSDYIKYDNGDLTIALTFFTAVSSILFLFEVYNGYVALKALCAGAQDLFAEVEVWREVVSFALLMIEDFPVTAIMYAAFRWGNCHLYIQIFEDTFLARLSLLASFGSALLKGLLSLKYCLQVILKEDYTPWKKRKRRKHSDVLEPDPNRWKFRQSGAYSRSRSRPRLSRQKSMTWQDRCFCCSCVRCRPLRFIVNVVVCVFTAYVGFTFYKQDIMDRRPECAHLLDNYNSRQISSNSSLGL